SQRPIPPCPPCPCPCQMPPSCGVAQRVDQSGHAAGVLEDGCVGVLGKYAPPLRSCHFETMVDVGVGFSLAEGGQMEAQAHALRELDEFRRVQLVVQLRLPGEND